MYGIEVKESGRVETDDTNGRAVGPNMSIVLRLPGLQPGLGKRMDLRPE